MGQKYDMHFKNMKEHFNNFRVFSACLEIHFSKQIVFYKSF